MKPHKYIGPILIDYKIVNYNIAKIIRLYVSKYKDKLIEFYISNHYRITINDANIFMKIIEDKNIISSYNLLINNGICQSSYYIYDIIASSLINHNIDDNLYDYSHVPNENDILKKAKKLNLE